MRDEEGFIAAALLVEVDEDSHTSRKSICEVGKVDETFQSILTFAQNERKMGDAKADEKASHMPFVVFYKFNPNACDDPGGPIKLDERIQVLANACNKLLNTPASVFHGFSDIGRCMKPGVACLYYHSKRGGHHLAYFDEHCPGQWDWYGNQNPRLSWAERSGEE